MVLSSAQPWSSLEWDHLKTRNSRKERETGQRSTRSVIQFFIRHWVAALVRLIYFERLTLSLVGSVTILWTQKGCLLCELDCRHVSIVVLLSLLNIKMIIGPVAWPCNAISRQDLINNSPYCLPFNSHDVSSENLVLEQLKIPVLIFSHRLPAWYCINIVRRSSVLITHGNKKVKPGFIGNGLLI